MKINTAALKYFLLLFNARYSLPKLFLNNINEIEIEQLTSGGIKGIIFDIDQTLTLPNNFKIYPEYLEKFKQLSQKFKVCALTNQSLSLSPKDSLKRIQLFKNEYDLEVISPEIKKPDPSSFDVALFHLSLPKNQVIFIGDRIITDIIGSNLADIKSIYVNPIDVSLEPFIIRFFIKMESFIIKIIRKIILREENANSEIC